MGTELCSVFCALGSEMRALLLSGSCHPDPIWVQSIQHCAQTLSELPFGPFLCWGLQPQKLCCLNRGEMLFSPTCFYSLLLRVRHNWDASLLGHERGQTESTNLGCADHPRFPVPVEVWVVVLLGSAHGYSGQNSQSYHLHGLMCPQNTNILHQALPCLSPGCWLPGGHQALWDAFSRGFTPHQNKGLSLEAGQTQMLVKIWDLSQIVTKSWLFWGVK